jgi:uncharacterized protein (TIGR00730 family)
LATALVNRKVGLVYGGARVGLMGALADTVLSLGGNVIGVMPQALVEKEVAHTGLSELRVVSSMHERKAMMAQLSDGFIALPGGFGTFEEYFEVVTWAQLGLHNKPCALFNVAGYFDPMITAITHSIAEGFVRPENGTLVVSSSSIDDLFAKMASNKPRHVRKWISQSES